MIYKLSSWVFNFGKLDFDNKFLNDIIDLLNLGLKFVPSFFSNQVDFFNFLLNELDDSLYEFNSKFFFKKSNLLSQLN